MYYLISPSPEHLSDSSGSTPDQHGTFPVSSHQYSGASGMSITISNHHRTLKRVTLRFGNTPDMIETPLRSMISRVLWKAMLMSASAQIVCS